MAIGAGAVGFGLLSTKAWRPEDSNLPLRPPGATNEHLLRSCLRCAACVRACPTGALSPAVTSAGIEGLWSPILIPRQGYCDYSCNVCGLVCPVQAIPPLALEAKRRQVIGVAEIDQDRCLPWAEDTDCIVCEEMCPLPEKAIRLEEQTVPNCRGEMVTVRRPRVIRDICTGCGICEYQCPLNGEAAIRVYVPNDSAAPPQG